MTTFTQLIDEMVLETLRPELRQTMGDYLNQTIREMHNKPGPNTEVLPVFYPDNRMEDLITLSGVGDTYKYIWDIPNMTRFQAIEAVWYKGPGRYALPRTPKNAMGFNVNEVSARWYYYRSGPYFTFSNPGLDGQEVALSWFEYPRNLPTYGLGLSPIKYDITMDAYIVNPQYTGPTLTYDEAMNLSTNWLLQRHTQVMREGLRAKIYKRISDGSDRARLAFSQFESLKTGVQNAESLELTYNYGN